MPSRRTFLKAAAAGLAGATIAARSTAAQEIETALDGPVGLQLWSLREYLPTDLRHTLRKVRALGFREVEGAGLWGYTAAEVRAALDAAGLRCESTHMPFERLRDDLPGAFAEAKAVGATWLVCPWIPHETAFTRDDAIKAADAFNRIARSAEAEGLRFAYHCHGYEFVRSPEGTLFDTITNATDPARVLFQIDVFHAQLGGAAPAALIDRLEARVRSLHLKDLKKGVAIVPGTATAPPEADVPLGTGQVDMPAVLRSATRAGTSRYYIEDESLDPWGHIPLSIAYLASVTP